MSRHARNRLPSVFLAQRPTYNDCYQTGRGVGIDCIEHGGSMTDETNPKSCWIAKLPISHDFLCAGHSGANGRNRTRPSHFADGKSRSAESRRRQKPVRRPECACQGGRANHIGTEQAGPAGEADSIVAGIGASWWQSRVCPTKMDALRAITARRPLF